MKSRAKLVYAKSVLNEPLLNCETRVKDEFSIDDLKGTWTKG
jgi:hypothetical protein